jgi:hypothetical protein
VIRSHRRRRHRRYGHGRPRALIFLTAGRLRNNMHASSRGHREPRLAGPPFGRHAQPHRSSLHCIWLLSACARNRRDAHAAGLTGRPATRVPNRSRKVRATVYGQTESRPGRKGSLLNLHAPASSCACAICRNSLLTRESCTQQASSLFSYI